MAFDVIGGLLRCAKGKHERSDKHITKTSGGGYVSTCRHCRIPMKRHAKRQWEVISRAEFKSLLR